MDRVPPRSSERRLGYRLLQRRHGLTPALLRLLRDRSGAPHCPPSWRDDQPNRNGVTHTARNFHQRPRRHRPTRSVLERIHVATTKQDIPMSPPAARFSATTGSSHWGILSHQFLAITPRGSAKAVRRGAEWIRPERRSAALRMPAMRRRPRFGFFRFAWRSRERDRMPVRAIQDRSRGPALALSQR